MHLSAICRYPIKGLSAESLSRAVLTRKHGIPGDRAYAFAFTDRLDPAWRNAGDSRQFPWTSKTKLAAQMEWPGLAALQVKYPAEHKVSIEHPQLSGTWELERDQDRVALQVAMSRYLQTCSLKPGAPIPSSRDVVLVGGGDCARFPDRDKYQVSILSSSSLKALEGIAGRKIDINSFRGNFIIDDSSPWEEFKWVGQTWALGDAQVSIQAPIVRCFNINVDPNTGDVGTDLLAPLVKTHRKAIFGVIATIEREGSCTVGDPFKQVSG